jgi:potassium voltage-gated channel Shal-related subfamily D protein 2
LQHPELWEALEAFVVIAFSLEYAARAAVCDDLRQFVFEPMNGIDLVAIAPWYLELLGLVGSGSSVFRIFRLARVMRVFKLGKYAAGLQLFGRTLVASADALYLLIFFIALATIITSSSIYYAERGVWSTEQQRWVNDAGEPSQFTSIPAAFWWCLVTLTTVGYGDVVPITFFGRIVAVCTMLAGVLTIALPVSILGSNFQVQYEAAERERKRKDISGARTVSDATALASPLQQELSKLGNLFAEMDGLLRVAQENQATLLRLANSSTLAAGATGEAATPPEARTSYSES